ncbi:MAG: 4Fe-4S binding protein [Bacteroidales bacterium]|nr:4Fe-4S binding protein [Bacteroidales bacterium]
MNIVYASLGVLLVLFASKLARKKKAKGKVIMVDERSCIRCNRCVERCRHNVLEIVENEHGQSVEATHPERCCACGDCLKACDFNALYFFAFILDK